ncbi:DUF255 domain-containing protein, partial [Bacillus subtilis]|uniref:DUF255 domain-containing protein n=1 Tax=Bacillus subtilis TaxID=1423 RepID=UPI00092C096C
GSVSVRGCPLMTGQGVLPLYVFITPDQTPFYAGTYFPKTSKFNRPGFVDVLEHLSEPFANDREHVEDIAENAAKHLHTKTAAKSGEGLSESAISRTFQQLASGFDTIYGGLGQAQKFPLPHMLMDLLRHHHNTGQENDLYNVAKTLDRLTEGGISDLIGAGVAR